MLPRRIGIVPGFWRVWTGDEVVDSCRKSDVFQICRRPNRKLETWFNGGRAVCWSLQKRKIFYMPLYTIKATRNMGIIETVIDEQISGLFRQKLFELQKWILLAVTQKQ
jgi:hypothetical protein